MQKKEKLKNNPKAKDGLVFIMWGGYAQKLRKPIEQMNEKSQPVLPIEFVENNHPAATGDSLVAFHRNNSFTKANAGLVKLSLTGVNWFAVKGNGGAEETTGSSSEGGASNKRKGKDEGDNSKTKKGKTSKSD